jgi:acyl-coenzyme A thioesterase PaaI-like protein
MTDSRLARRLGQLDRAPAFLRPWLRDRVLGRAVPLVGTARLHFERIGPDGVVISIANRRSVQNHIGGVHAAAMALLAETATGFCLGWHLPDDRLPLIKSLQVEFQRRTQGDLRAQASLTPDQIARIISEPKGELVVPVDVRDASGEPPIRCTMLWAWVPRNR